jgi:hypothetical protein
MMLHAKNRPSPADTKPSRLSPAADRHCGSQTAALATTQHVASSPTLNHWLPLGLPLRSGLLLLLLPPRLLLRLLLLPPLLLRPAGDADADRPRAGLLLTLRPLAAPLPVSRSRLSGLAERLLSGLRLLLRPLLRLRDLLPDRARPLLALRERLLLPDLARPLLRGLLGLRLRLLLPDLARPLLRLREGLTLRERLLLPDRARPLLRLLPRERDLDRDLISSSNLVPLQQAEDKNACNRKQLLSATYSSSMRLRRLQS